jgi:undecaprenyl diphosphate synthase
MKTMRNVTRATSEITPPLVLAAVPDHVAIIMDGNGRWAKQRGRPRLFGHRAGTENVRRVIERFGDYGVKYLTLFAFSTENWDRPRYEVRGLMSLLSRFLKRETKHLHENGIRLLHLGDLSPLSPQLQQQVRDAIELTRDNRRMTLSIAFNYGGRAEIVEAVRRIVDEGVPADEIDERTISSRLLTDGLPDPDLIIRTAGEMRLSNFLLWQGAYAEFCFTPVYWPDFDVKHVDEALLNFSRRTRRFGGLPPHEVDRPAGNGHENGRYSAERPAVSNGYRA